MTGGYGQTWRARVGAGRRVVGAGTVISPDLVLTCAHVVAQALDADASGPAPTDVVTLDFPGSTSRAPVVARVRHDGWAPVAEDNGGDLALLSVEETLPADVRAARLRPCDDPGGRRVRAFGHPAGLDGGVWARADLIGSGGPFPGWMQFDGLDTAGRPVAAGFSGAGVLDESDSVIGMVVAADRARETKVAWMIPVEVIGSQLPPLAGLISPPRGRATDTVSWSDVNRLAQAIGAIPVMSDERSRQHVVDALRPAIAGTIPRNSSRLIDIYGIVRTCLDHPGGLAELVSVIRGFSGDSITIAHLDDLIAEMGLDGA